MTLRNSRLAKDAITIHRHSGAYIEGVYVIGDSVNGSLADAWVFDAGSADASGIIPDVVETETTGSIQPYRSIEADLVFQSLAGENISQLRLLWSSERIIMFDKSPGVYATGDLIEYKGELWKPIKVDDWTVGNLPHYRTVLRLFDGY